MMPTLCDRIMFAIVIIMLAIVAFIPRGRR